jgi:hypothetical protein
MRQLLARVLAQQISSLALACPPRLHRVNHAVKQPVLACFLQKTSLEVIYAKL